MSRRKKESDRLKALQRLKEIREDQAKAEVVRSREAESNAKDEVGRKRRETDEAAVLPMTTMPVAMLRALQIAGWASAENLKLAEVEYERTLERRLAAQKQLTEAAIGRRSIEKLAARREHEAIVARRDAADRAMDELYLLSRGRRP